MADLDTGASAPPAKKKFSLFKKKLTPAQAPELKPGMDHTDAFSRAKDLFPLHAREREIKREKKVASLERKRSSQSREKSSSSPRVEKRRKFSNEDMRGKVDLGSETEDEEPARYLSYGSAKYGVVYMLMGLGNRPYLHLIVASRKRDPRRKNVVRRGV